MKGLESGKDKVKKICEVLKRETLEPAKREADEIIQKAEEQAKKIIADAQQKAMALEELAKQEMNKEKNVFQSSLHQACRQSFEKLKQEIENHLFNTELNSLLSKSTSDPKIISQLLTAVMNAIEKEGVDTDISAYVSSQVSAEEINTLLSKNILARLKEHSVTIGTISGGAVVKLNKDNISLDVSDAALKELVSKYIRKDFRQMLFTSNI
ncbi:MAG: V-type ATP synthase subunit E [Chlamydiae bacterium]|nr:V-type ATP synthase subunit E [Chlamydiota bacterium]